MSTIDEFEAALKTAQSTLEAYSQQITANARAVSFEEQLRLGQLRQAVMVASLRLAGARAAARLGIADY